MKPDTTLKIKNKNIGLDCPTYFIADIAANHDGDLSRAKDLIFMAADAGADAAKFQHFNASTIVSDVGFKSLGGVKSHQSNWGKSVFDVYRDASVDLSWSHILQETCDKAGIHFFTSPYSLDLVDHIDPYVPAYKIGSGDVTWLDIIRYIASKKKPYILATGAANIQEVQNAVDIALSLNTQFALLQCNTNYTGDLDNLKFVNLNVLKTYRAMYPDMILGLSDHTSGCVTVLGAIALGAKIIEKHFTDDNARVGPDHAFSMDPRSWREMVAKSRELENALGDGIKRVEENERETVVLQRRAVRLRQDFDAGHQLIASDVEVLRPCPVDAIPLSELPNLMGRTLRKRLARGDYLRWTDIE